MSELDLVGAISLTGGAAAFTGVLVPAILRGEGARYSAGALLGVWFVAVVAASATGLFGPVRGFGVPVLGVAVLLPIVVAILIAERAPNFRAALRAVPASTLVAAHTVRVLGAAFILLYLSGRLPTPFALEAGFGDIAIGVTAPFMAWLILRQGPGWRVLLWLWNSLGLLDLVAAVTLGVTSAAGSPLRLFFTGPSSNTITDLPWIIIPAFMVPLLALIHIVLFARLGVERGPRHLGASLSSLAN